MALCSILFRDKLDDFINIKLCQYTKGGQFSVIKTNDEMVSEILNNAVHSHMNL